MVTRPKQDCAPQQGVPKALKSTITPMYKARSEMPPPKKAPLVEEDETPKISLFDKASAAPPVPKKKMNRNHKSMVVNNNSRPLDKSKTVKFLAKYDNQPG